MRQTHQVMAIASFSFRPGECMIGSCSIRARRHKAGVLIPRDRLPGPILPRSPEMKLETIAVRGGYTPDPTTHVVAVPIYQTVSYAFDDTQHGADLFDLKVPGNIYTRIM